MTSPEEVATRIMEHLVSHDGTAGHGYSQGSNRWGNGRSESIEIDGVRYSFAGGNRDCSAAIISAYEAAGVDCGGATYTGNMRTCMCKSGNFAWLATNSALRRGDILLCENAHAALCKTTTSLMEFLIDENGGIVGGRGGDQTGRESLTRPMYNFPWDGVLRYCGSGVAAPKPQPSETSLPPIRYRACSQKRGWLPEMIDHRDTGGSDDTYAGDGSPIVYLAIDMTGWYQVRTKRSGWLSKVRGYNVRDLNRGCAGDGSPITGVRCYYETPHPEKTGWLAIEYAVANVGGDFLPAMRDLVDTSGSRDDFAGNGKPIGAFRAKLVRVS